jgi:PAS domain S-box-containing protein
LANLAYWTILYIEDDQENYLLIKELLHQAPEINVNLVWSKLLENALQKLQSGQAFDAILINANSHTFDSLAAVRAVKASHNAPPILLIASQVNRELDLAAMQAGGSLLLLKEDLEPTRLERFLRYIITCQYSANQQVNAEHTGRLRAEDLLRQGNEAVREGLFKQLADSMPQLVWMAQPDGMVDYYNNRYKQYSGIEPTVGGIWQWAPVLHPDDLQATVDAWSNALRTEKPYQAEHRVQMSDGEYRWHLSRGLPVHDSSGRLLRWFGTATDIHEQKLTEEALRDQEEALRLLVQRVEKSNNELEQFAFVASHDLQEPLRKVQAFGDILKESAAERLSTQEQDYLERMVRAANRMQNMIQALLSLSRITTQGRPFETIELNHVAQEVLSDLEVQIRQTSGQVIVSDLPSMQGDPAQIYQLVQNLVGNALKFHSEGAMPFVQVYSLPHSDSSTMIQLVIEDNGIGMNPDTIDRIFLPFTRLNATNFEGTGMGLAICQKIVERHGGQITVESVPHKGSRFTITLPKSHSSAGL